MDYGTFKIKISSLSDLNRRPTHYECVALPTELRKHVNSNIIQYFNEKFNLFLRFLLLVLYRQKKRKMIL